MTPDPELTALQAVSWLAILLGLAILAVVAWQSKKHKAKRFHEDYRAELYRRQKPAYMDRKDYAP